MLLTPEGLDHCPLKHNVDQQLVSAATAVYLKISSEYHPHDRPVARPSQVSCTPFGAHLTRAACCEHVSFEFVKKTKKGAVVKVLR